jgi:hypothetical protein
MIRARYDDLGEDSEGGAESVGGRGVGGDAGVAAEDLHEGMSVL